MSHSVFFVMARQYILIYNLPLGVVNIHISKSYLIFGIHTCRNKASVCTKLLGNNV